MYAPRKSVRPQGYVLKYPNSALKAVYMLIEC